MNCMPLLGIDAGTQQVSHHIFWIFGSYFNENIEKTKGIDMQNIKNNNDTLVLVLRLLKIAPWIPLPLIVQIESGFTPFGKGMKGQKQ